MSFLRTIATLFIAVSVAAAMAPISHTPSGRPIYEAPSGSRLLQNGTDMVVYAPNGTRLHVFENIVGARTSTSTGTGPLRPRQTYGGGLGQGGPFYTGAAFVEHIPSGVFSIFTFANATVTEQINVGDTVGISMTFQGVSNDTGPTGPFTAYNYFVEFVGPIAQAAALPTIGTALQGPPALAGFRVDEEGVSAPSDYPGGPLVFKDVKLQLTTGFPENIDWEVQGTAATGVDFTVVKGGSEDGEIEFVFPDGS
uniref:Uncharacterized protein n=1 Tax=Mycena chlorophos TaxID=658473 RepID=A0ABQ0L4Q3_MYCCL|nr:predicted protein [Mycena chlorophos]